MIGFKEVIFTGQEVTDNDLINDVKQNPLTIPGFYLANDMFVFGNGQVGTYRRVAPICTFLQHIRHEFLDDLPHGNVYDLSMKQINVETLNSLNELAFEVMDVTIINTSVEANQRRFDVYISCIHPKVEQVFLTIARKIGQPNTNYMFLRHEDLRKYTWYPESDLKPIVLELIYADYEKCMVAVK